jgi:hypothetical protein
VHADQPLDHIALDLACPGYTTPSGHTYLLVVVDVATRFTWLRPLRDKTAASVARALWPIFMDFGLPRIIQSDNGREFSNSLLAEFLLHTGTEHRFSTPYHPRGNGLAERFVQSALGQIRTFSNGDGRWDEHVLRSQYALNSKTLASRHTSTPFAVMFGRRATDPGDYSATPPSSSPPLDGERRVRFAQEVLFPAMSTKSRQSETQSAASFNASHRTTELIPGAQVMVATGRATKLAPAYSGPFTIMRRSRGGTYTLADAQGQLASRDYAPSQLKLIAPAPRSTMLAIINHRSSPSAQYLVRFSDYPSKPDEWLAVPDVPNAMIQAYTARRLPPSPPSSSEGG